MYIFIYLYIIIRLTRAEPAPACISSRISGLLAAKPRGRDGTADTAGGPSVSNLNHTARGG